MIRWVSAPCGVPLPSQSFRVTTRGGWLLGLEGAMHRSPTPPRWTGKTAPGLNSHYRLRFSAGRGS